MAPPACSSFVAVWGETGIKTTLCDDALRLSMLKVSD
jgi:hypothetical protein